MDYGVYFFFIVLDLPYLKLNFPPHDNTVPMRGVMTGVDVVVLVAATEIGLLVVAEEATVIVLAIEAMAAVSVVVEWKDPRI